jgi:aspartyl/glutamyl-tRNA(Asn/Gln) amidotransferase C subunit
MQLEDVKKLADLARIDMEEKEMQEIAKDFDSILTYVGQIKEAAKLIPGDQNLAEKRPEDYFLHNIMRDDIVTNNRGEYTERIISQMPDTQDGYLKVKQIL